MIFQIGDSASYHNTIFEDTCTGFLSTCPIDHFAQSIRFISRMCDLFRPFIRFSTLFFHYLGPRHSSHHIFLRALYTLFTALRARAGTTSLVSHVPGEFYSGCTSGCGYLAIILRGISAAVRRADPAIRLSLRSYEASDGHHWRVQGI